ncbi:TonB-dependent receptor [Prosthecobacter sp.]|uniref:TonB-dependent receptor n=1 Tax=Prosthecobacter sp. TaxID=1965333 RepID=UPI002ABCC414|nr:TonB-dependent receptor [Prosthecobacter sp.]MDZ4403364.1 TonB-dependent receptor [Prosthecobacter sp.]
MKIPLPSYFLTAALSLTAVGFSTAQTASRIEKLASQPTLQSEIAMDEIVISAPLDRPLFQQAQATSVLTGQPLNLAIEPSLGQTLARLPGVSSSYFGPAASRPIIRGLDGDRVRILQNGLNTIDASSASPDHAVSFDVANLKSVEVIRGPATLLYGSNAIGGVVNAIDGRIVDEKLDGTIRGSMGGRFSSVDSGYQSNAMLEGGWKGLAFHVEAFTRAAEDFHIPGNARTVGEQERNPLPAGDLEPSKNVPNSHLRSEGVSGGLSYVWEGGFVGFAWTEFHSLYGSPAEPSVFIDLNQTRLDVRGAFYKPLPRIKEISYRFAWSDYEHVEYEDGMDNTVFKNDGYDARVEVKHEKIAGMEGVVGFQSDRSDFLIAGAEAFLPPNITQSNSLFFFEDITRGPLSFQFGGRYDHISVEALDNDVFGPARSRTFDNFSGSVGVVFNPNDEYSAAFTVTHAERAPTSQELYANGAHLATNTFEVGNADLGVESSLGFDLNLRKRTGWVTGSVSGYYNRYNDFIGQFPTGVMVDTDGDLIGDTPEYAYTAVAAQFIGAELETTFHLLHPVTTEQQATTNLNWEFKADAVRARDASTGRSLPRIPPFHLSSALIVERGPFGAKLEGIYAAPQARVAASEFGTDSYFLVNLTLSYRVVQGPTTIDLYVKGMNLTNEDAREHTSFLKERVPLPGRGIVAGMKMTF